MMIGHPASEKEEPPTPPFTLMDYNSDDHWRDVYEGFSGGAEHVTCLVDENAGGIVAYFLVDTLAEQVQDLLCQKVIWIVATGNPFAGIRLHGPFSDPNDATAWLEKRGVDGWVTFIDPKDVDDPSVGVPAWVAP